MNTLVTRVGVGSVISVVPISVKDSVVKIVTGGVLYLIVW